MEWIMQVVGGFWFALNIGVWLFPRLRRQLIRRRGVLLGIGFAFGAALVSSFVDAYRVGLAQAGVLFFARFIVIVIPFIYAYVSRLPRAVHPTDWLVLGYAVLLPQLPFFQGAWFSLGGAAPAAGFITTVGPGNLTALALITTYFFGVRWWSELVIEWTVRRGDVKRGIATALIAAVGAGVILSANLDADPLKTLVFPVSYLLLIVAIPVEELIFRGLILAGLKGYISRAPIGVARELVRIGVAAVTGLAHTAFGVYGIDSPFAAFVFSTGIGLVAIRGNRLLPSIIGHGLGLTIIWIWAVVL